MGKCSSLLWRIFFASNIFPGGVFTGFTTKIKRALRKTPPQKRACPGLQPQQPVHLIGLHKNAALLQAFYTPFEGRCFHQHY